MNAKPVERKSGDMAKNFAGIRNGLYIISFKALKQAELFYVFYLAV